MTFAVTSHAVLADTGHTLVASQPVTVAYGLIALAAFSRWVGAAIDEMLHMPMLLLAGGLWVLAIAMFVAAIGPIALSPRLPCEAP